MAIKPKNSGKKGGGGDYTPRNFPVPEAGLRPARISLIVDLGTQEREDFEDPNTKEVKPQKPCHQLAVFADLVDDVVDYGGDIGEKQYRLMLNKSFQGKVQGINFVTMQLRDAKGNAMTDKPWQLHPANMLTKLAKAIGQPNLVVEDANGDLDIEPMLGEALMIDVDVKITEHKEGKLDKDGNVIVYKNVNFKNAVPVPKKFPVPDLETEAKYIGFDNATKEDITFIRGNLLKMIKLSVDYPNSAMQEAVEAWEAEHGKEEEAEKPAPAPAPAPKPASKPASKTAPKQPVTDMDDDIPF